MTRELRRIVRLRSQNGQATAAALAALTIGMLVVSPLLGQASTTTIGSRTYEAEMVSQYSSDAGIEWGLWRMKDNPTLTTSTTYTESPLQPFPATINGSSFPTTQIRYVSMSGQTTTTNPPWQPAQNWVSYTVAVPPTTSATITATVVASTGTCHMKLVGGAQYNLSGGPPFVASWTVTSGGNYTIQVRTPGYNGSGTIQFDVTTDSVYTYDVMSQGAETTITTRATVSAQGAVSVVTWQVQ